MLIAFLFKELDMESFGCSNNGKESTIDNSCTEIQVHGL